MVHAIDTRVVSIDLAARGASAKLDEATADLDVGLLVAAAEYGTSGKFLDADLTTEFEMIELNCSAVLAQAHLFGRRFAQRGSGGLILLSSLVAWQGAPLAANYAATKA